MVTAWPPLTLLGHGFADAGPLPLPPATLVAIAAALTAAAAALPSRTGPVAAPVAGRISRRPRLVLRVAAVAGVVAIAVPAVLGPGDVALNPAPRLLFTVAWAGMLLVSALVGPWWRHASPLRAAAGGSDAADGAGPGVWPAVVGLTAFGGFEQVLDPTPLVALLALGLYLVLGLVVVVRAGGRGLAGADPLEVASSVIGSLAPVARGRRRLRSPRRGVAAHPVVPGLAVFLGVLTGINLFDALAPGGPPALRAGIYLVVAAGAGVLFWSAARPAFLTPALIPAVAGHLGAHYLAPLLVDTQIAAVLASDPLRRGWNLLGLTGTEIVAEPIPPQAGLVLQLVLLIAGHALAMTVAGDLARSRLPPRAAAAALFPIRAAVMLSVVLGVYLRFGGVG